MIDSRHFKDNMGKLQLTIQALCLFVAVYGQFETSFLDSFVGVSLSECEEACLRYASCRSTTYNRRKIYCKLWNQRTGWPVSQVKTPGLVYKDGEDFPEFDLPRQCATETCIEDQACRGGKCRNPVCSHPDVDASVIMSGNLLKTGSKLRQSCQNGIAEPVTLECGLGGLWSGVSLDCNVYGYVFAGENTYGRVLSSSDRPVFTSSSSQLDACFNRCNQSRSCCGISFNPVTRVCQSANYFLLTSYNYKIGWRYYQKILPVTMHGKSAYAFTYEEGVAYCQSIGTTIASSSDFGLMHELGYHWCAWGWIDEGYVVMSLMVNCGRFAAGVRLVQETPSVKAFVYCKNPDYRAA